MASKTPLPALAQLQKALTRCNSKIAEALQAASDAITEVSNAKADKSHTHASIVTNGDTRGTATTPNTYKSNFIFQGLKNNSTIGSPSGDTYSYLFGFRGWSDSSGGNAHELAFNNTGVYWRNGGTTTWGSWNRLLTSLNYKSIVKPADIGAAVAIAPKTLTIPASGWSSDSTAGYPQYVDVAVSGLTASDTVCCIIAPASASAADAAQLCGACESLAGKLRIRAKHIPAAALTATYYIVR